MYICICGAVTDHQIRDAVRDGAHTLEALRSRLGVASQCGKCTDEVKRILHETLAASRPPSRARRRAP
jgi:bacterioferritin-associated ferredoxin